MKTRTRRTAGVSRPFAAEGRRKQLARALDRVLEQLGLQDELWQE
ncbi:MAG TPA: hypothetical protein VEL76_05580 [Gemmataceae bacterium]|nr:hypothetical protein [Gemmataceae bacterium]